MTPRISGSFRCNAALRSTAATVVALCAFVVAAPPTSAHPDDEGAPQIAVISAELRDRRRGPNGASVVDVVVGVALFNRGASDQSLFGVDGPSGARARMVERARTLGFAYERALLQVEIPAGQSRFLAPPDGYVLVVGAPVEELVDGSFELQLDFGWTTAPATVRLAAPPRPDAEDKP